MGWQRIHPHVHDDVDPAVRFLLGQLRRYGEDMGLEVDAGLGTDTVRHWRYKRGAKRLGPHITTLRQALNALGYDLAVISLETGEIA